MSKGVRTHSSGSSGLLSRFVSLAVFLITFKWLQHFRIVSLEARRLTGLLLHGTKTWLIMLGRLLVYVIIMMPGWYDLLRYWLFDDKILRNIEYGKGSLSRNVLDVYLPNGSLRWNSSRGEEGFSKGSPVVIFVGGGVWIIGNKLWSALIARSLASMGYLVIVPDYRNFPQGTIEDMCEDLTSSLQWAVENCWHYGGDKNHVILAGQSAGAHIVLCSVLDLFEGKRRRGGGRDLNFSEVAPPSRIPQQTQQMNEQEQEQEHQHEHEHGSRVFHRGGADEGYLEVDSGVLARSGGSEGHSIIESLIHSQQGEAGTYADLSQCLDNSEITESGTAAGAAPDTATVLQPASPGFFSRIYSGMRGLPVPSPPRSRSRSRSAQSVPIPIPVPGAGNTGNRDSDSVSFGSLLNPGYTHTQDRAPSSSPFSASFERERDSSLAYMSPLTSSVVTAADESFMSASLSQRSLQASFDLGLGAEVNGLELTSLSPTARDMNDTSRGSGSDDGHEGGSLLKPARGSSSGGGGGDSDSGSGSGEDSDGENDTWRECRTPAARGTGRTSDKDKASDKDKDRGEDEDEDGERGGGSTKPTTPYSGVLSRSASSDGLDTDYVYFVSSSPHRGSGAPSVDDGDEVTVREWQGEEGGQQQEETDAERALREALLASVKQLVLLNGPYDLCTLQSHLHRRGLDSSILRWIFGDFSHFSPTLRIKALDARIKLAREQGRGQGQAPSWEAFPPVGLFSCSEDKSIPLEQGRGLLGALREVSYHLHDAGTDGTGECEGEGEGDGEGRLGACLVEYAGQIHTSLVVEGPLEGDSTLPRDFDAMVQLVHESGARALSTFTPESSKGSGGSKMKTARATRSRGRDMDRDRDRERERERREPPAVHPWLVAIAKRVNPF